MRTPRSLVVPFWIALLASSSVALGDPRWWWSDAQAVMRRASDIDIAVAPGCFGQGAIFLAWIEPPVMMEGSLLLSASFDGGCTFCQPVHLATLFDANAEVSVGAAVADLPAPGTTVPVAIQVLLAASGSLQVHHSVPYLFEMGNAQRACDDLLAATWGSTTLAASGAALPDIAGIGVVRRPGDVAQFHAVWRDMAPTDEESVQYARDLVGDGTGWEVRGPIILPSSPIDAVRDPKVTVDAYAGGGPGSAAAGVNVACIKPASGEVLYLRSTDSGTNFSATGDPAPSPPAVVNDPMAVAAFGPLALDSGPAGSTGEPLWHGAFWYGSSMLPNVLALDAQFQSAPATPDPAWGADFPLVVTGGPTPDTSVALSVLPGGGGGSPTAAFAFWRWPRATGQEILSHAAQLDAGAGTPVDIATFPFPPVRPLDPAASVDVQLTACTHDEATGDCTPDRKAGSALLPVSADSGGDVYLAWVDDRNGSASIWFKRTDRTVAPTDPVLSVSCPTPATRRITVSFPQLSTCGGKLFAPEKILRYLIYYGQTPGGPYENTDLAGTDPGVPDTIVLPDDGSLPDPVVATIDAVAPGATYYVIAVPEDDARNVYPPDFDPLAHAATSPPNEKAILVPAGCPRDLYRTTTGLFVSPRPPNDIAFAPPHDVPYIPAFASGDPDPERVLERGVAPPLVYYQVEGADVTDLRLVPDWDLESVRIVF